MLNVKELEFTMNNFLPLAFLHRAAKAQIPPSSKAHKSTYKPRS